MGNTKILLPFEEMFKISDPTYVSIQFLVKSVLISLSYIRWFKEIALHVYHRIPTMIFVMLEQGGHHVKTMYD